MLALKMVTVWLGVALAVGGSTLPPPPPPPLYFGFYDAPIDGPDEPSSHTNFYHARNPADAVAAKAKGQNSLLMVLDYFPGIFGPNPDFSSRWLPVRTAIIITSTLL